MDYEKAYKDALERVKELLSHCIDDRDRRTKVYRVEDIESIFSELKESKDEKVRKGLIKYFKNFDSESLYTVGLNEEEIISWLEKQKEFVSTDFDDVWEWADGDELTAPLEKYSKDAIKEMCHAWYDKGIELERKSWLEKQGEQKETLCDKCKKDQPSHSCQDITALGRCTIEKQGEQKPSIRERYNRIKDSEWFKRTHEGMSVSEESVEPKPKFHRGDWIVNRNGELWKIKEVLRNTYDIESLYGSSLQPIKTVDTDCHLWTIQDAKDGDVLAENKGDVILIFRKIGNTSWDDVIDYHCYYDCYQKDFIVQESVKYWGTIENNQLVPATKEQRDQLEKAMADAGYIFDFEKKELKKIEKNSTWSEEDEDNLDCCIGALKSYFGEQSDEFINWIKSLKKRIGG